MPRLLQNSLPSSSLVEAELNRRGLIVNNLPHTPEQFLREVLDVEYLTPQQLAVIDSVYAHRRTAVPAAHAVGKTYLAARLALWFLYTHTGAKVLTTAPTWFQVQHLLWRDIRTAHGNARKQLGGILNQTALDIADDWFAVGLSTNDSTRFQGIHARRVMVIFDEATGVADDIWEAAEGVAVGDDDRFLAIGNPTDPLSRFKRVCDSGLWNVVRLSAEQHPNVLQNCEVIPGAVTRRWVEERLTEYGGRDTALARARVLGQFPEQGEDMLISLSDVERAQQNWLPPTGTPNCVGCDVARYGSDETVIIAVYDDHTVGVPMVTRGQDLMTTTGRLVACGARQIKVDDCGVGGGVTDRLREIGKSVTAINAGAAALDAKRFFNRRAELWWGVRERLQAYELRLPPDVKLAADITNVKYSYDSRGRIKLESKDEIKKRLKRSPDRGDALAIALAAAPPPSRMYAL